jgi:hypothetical protein
MAVCKLVFGAVAFICCVFFTGAILYVRALHNYVASRQQPQRQPPTRPHWLNYVDESFTDQPNARQILEEKYLETLEAF